MTKDSDRPNLAYLISKWLEEYWPHGWLDPVADEQGKRIGFIRCRCTKDSPYGPALARVESECISVIKQEFAWERGLSDSNEFYCVTHRDECYCDETVVSLYKPDTFATLTDLLVTAHKDAVPHIEKFKERFIKKSK